MIEATSSRRSMHLRKGLLGHHEEQADNNYENQDEVSASGRKDQVKGSLRQEQNMKEQVTEDSETKPSVEHGLLGRCAPPNAAQASEDSKREDVMSEIERISAQIMPPDGEHRDITIGDVTYFVKAP